MSRPFFIVRNAETDPKSDRLTYRRTTGINETDNVQKNTFDNFDAAQSAALEWAAKYNRGYRVYIVTEIGVAAPPAKPPAVWSPASVE